VKINSQGHSGFNTGVLAEARPGRVWRNLQPAQLVSEAIRRDEAQLSAGGAIVATTGKFTGRSPKDKFFVAYPELQDSIDWGTTNQALDPERFAAMRRRAIAHIADRELFVQDLFAGADPAHRVKVRVVTEQAWHNLFARNMFLPEDDAHKRASHRPEYTVINAPRFKADPARHGTRSEVAVLVHFGRKLVLIAGTEYGQHRQGRRYRAVLRPLRHRQDDAVERSGAAPDRRRRARLERHRRVQLRGRLLRQGDQALARGRAADLRDDAAVRDDPRKRHHRSRHPRARPRQRLAHRKHPRFLSDHLH
jgi:hypothetical protein